MNYMIHIKKKLTNACKTVVCIKHNGEIVFKNKQKFETQDDAIKMCKIVNSKENQIHKVVPYRCKHCGKYHIGRNGNLIKKYK